MIFKIPLLTSPEGEEHKIEILMKKELETKLKFLPLAGEARGGIILSILINL